MDVTEEDFQGSMMSWATVLTVGLNVALEADKRLGTGMFPWKGTNDTQAAGQGMNTDRANLDK
jgi:hypothetical protein